MDTITAPSQPDAARPGLLINRNFALLWAGQSVSALGDMLFDTTLILWIATHIAHGRSWAPLAVGGVLFATALPTVAVGPLAGVFADRWERRRTMLLMDVLRAALLALLLPMAAGLVHLPETWQLGAIYAVVALATTCAQFFNPSRLVLIRDIVADEQRTRASSLTQASATLATIAGPAVAAPLFFALGAPAALALDALSFVASFLAILMVRIPAPASAASQEQGSSVGRELADGLRFFAGNRVLMTVLVVVLLVMLGGGALNALDFFFVTQNLHAAASMYGILGAVYGAGTLIGAVLAGLVAPRIGVARTFWLCTLLMGVAMLVYARLTSFAPALAVLFLAGVPIAAVNVAVSPLVLHVTPREVVGRVAAVLTPAVSLASMLSVLVAGYLVSTVLHGFHATLLGLDMGPIDTIFSIAALLAIAAGLYAMVNLRGVMVGAPSADASAHGDETAAIGA